MIECRIEFNTKETQDFIEFATNKDPNATVIYYEDYLSRLYSFVDKHMENVMKGYASFQSKKWSTTSIIYHEEEY